MNAPPRIALPELTLPPAEALRKALGAHTWHKGQAYERDGAVAQARLVCDPSGSELFALQGLVQGTEAKPYEQEVVLRRSVRAGWSVEGDCTCPVGFNCKHVAALIQHVLRTHGMPRHDRPAAGPHATLDAWLAESERAEQSSTHAAQAADDERLASKRQDVAHLIVLDTITPPGEAGVWITLWPGQARKLKNRPGELGKVAQPRIPVHGALGPWDGHGVVFHLLRRWHASQSDSALWRVGAPRQTLPQHAVRDEFGAMLLESAAKAGELVTLNAERLVDRCLQWGPVLALGWEWIPRGHHDDGTPIWQLTPRLPAESAQLCLGDPLLYVDREFGTCGRVDGQGIGLPEAMRWLKSPAMPESWMRSQSMRLMKLLPPLPQGVRGNVVRTVKGVAPLACLRIRRHPHPRQSVFQIDLTFGYDGIHGTWRLHPDAELVEVDVPAGKAHLWRDLRAEASVTARLMSDGYAPLGASRLDTWQAMRQGGMSPHERDLALLDSDFAGWRQAGFHVDLEEGVGDALRQTGDIDLALAPATTPGTQGDPGGDWFGLSLGFSMGDRRVDLLPWLPQLVSRWVDWEDAAQRGQPWPTHTWLTEESGQAWRVPTEPLKPWLGALFELMQDHGEDIAPGRLKLDRFEAMRLAALADTSAGTPLLDVSTQDAQSLSQLVTALKQAHDLPAMAPPQGLAAKLRPYQQQGLNWLQHLCRHRLGGILADDMGLGKTLQTIAHLLLEKEAGRLKQPALIVAPTSLVGNWRSELIRFAPGLSTVILHGQQRRGAFARIGEHDVAVTTYPLLMRDEDVLLKQPWSIVVLDEAQTIKNAKTRAAAIVQTLQAGQRLCLTGTPMENHLGEVWSLFHFLMPGYLGSEARFRQIFRSPIEKLGHTDRLTLLRARLAPFMLRRTKETVAAELPPKIETVEHIELGTAQANLYETIRAATSAKVREAVSRKGFAGTQITVLDALLKLRQACCDPRLVPLDAARKVKDSAKIEWLADNLPAMIEEGRRVLVFSQFTSMLALVEEALAPTGLRWAKLTGQSRNREAIVGRFTSGEVPLFLISLKAGGVGLNLPQADTVVHIDPWWNPAAENQATDRAHRLGQQSTVFVYKLVAQGTLEERIVAMQARKAALAEGLHGSKGADAVQLSEAELDWLLQPIGTLRAKGAGPAQQAGAPDSPRHR